MWRVVDDWKTGIPILPVVTVEGSIVWFKRCQVRILQNHLGERHTQWRVLQSDLDHDGCLGQRRDDECSQ